MRKILIALFFLFSASVSFAATVLIGDTVYSTTKTIPLDCSRITDGNGVGMILSTKESPEIKGKMRFRIKKETDGVWGKWTAYEDYQPETTLSFPEVEVGNRYLVQGQFCDALGNCQKEENAVISERYFQYVEEKIQGTFTIKTDFTLLIEK